MIGLPQNRIETIMKECFEEMGGHIKYGREVLGVENIDSKVKITRIDRILSKCKTGTLYISQ